MSKLVRVSVETHQRLCDIGKKNESFNTIIERLLNNNDEYEEIKQLIQAEQEIERGEYTVYKSSKDLFKAIEEEN